MVVVTRFLQLGEEGYDLLKSGVGEGLADFCDERNSITLVVFFGYTIVALCTLHSYKAFYDVSISPERINELGLVCLKVGREVGIRREIIA